MEKRCLGYQTKRYCLVHDGHDIEIEFVVISPAMAGIGPIQSSRRHVAQLREHATGDHRHPDARSLKAMGINR